MMKRREFITLLGGAAAWPFAAYAQQQRGPVRLAFIALGSSSNRYDRSLVEAFQLGLRRVGLIENQDVVLDIVWAGDRPDQAVTDALQRGAELLIPCGSSASVAAKRQTSTIPIVFLNVGDPVAVGLVESLSRPGQNATGFSDILAELSGKLVDVARELIKPHRIIHYLWHTAWPDGQNRYQATEQAVRAAGMQLQSRGIAEISELDAAVAAIKMSGSPAFIVQPSPFTYGHRGSIIASAQKNGLGTIFAFPAAAREGALAAYGPDYVHMYSRAPFWIASLGARSLRPSGRGPSKVELWSTYRSPRRLGLRYHCPSSSGRRAT
jgi:putative ABC transport system substrate-binding protein